MQAKLLLIPLLHLLAFSAGGPIPTAGIAARSAVENYILIFEDGMETPDTVLDKLQSELKSIGAKINYEYQTIIKGFSVSLDSSLVNKLQALNDKTYPFILEQDKGVHAS